MKYFFYFSFLIAILSSVQAQNGTQPNIMGQGGVKVNSYTGNLLYQRQDLFIPARGLDIDITFAYNSSRYQNDYGLGRGWTFSYNMLYRIDTAGIIIERGGGRADLFSITSNVYEGPTGIFDQLQEYQPGKFRLTSKEGTKYTFDDSTHKRITQIEI